MQLSTFMNFTLYRRLNSLTATPIVVPEYPSKSINARKKQLLWKQLGHTSVSLGSICGIGQLHDFRVGPGHGRWAKGCVVRVEGYTCGSGQKDWSRGLLMLSSVSSITLVRDNV